MGDDPRIEDLGFARVDVDRARRTGDAEVVYGEGKTPEQVVAILRTLHARHPERAVLATRLSEEALAQVATSLPEAELDAVARAVTLGPFPEPRGTVAVVSAGTSDAPVAAEAALTVRVHGVGGRRDRGRRGRRAAPAAGGPGPARGRPTAWSSWPAWRARCRRWSAA